MSKKKKKISSAESSTFNIKVKVLKAESLLDLIEENSEELESYVNNLAAANQRNPQTHLFIMLVPTDLWSKTKSKSSQISFLLYQKLATTAKKQVFNGSFLNMAISKK